MAVYCKFKSAKDYYSIPIEGQFISVFLLKKRIFKSKRLGRDTDLMVSNAQTNEEYVDEDAMIPKNTSVLITRFPRRHPKLIVTEPEPDVPKVVEDKVEDLPPQLSSISIADSSVMRYPEESEWDDFGIDLYANPEVVTAQLSNPIVNTTSSCKVEEDMKIKALIDAPTLDWNCQTHNAYGAERGSWRGTGGRIMGGRSFGRGGLEYKTPPADYICHRCYVPGHFIHHCPTNGDPNYEFRRLKPPTGNGAIAIIKPDEAAFEKEIEGIPSIRPVSDAPPEMRCPLCKEVMKDAVTASKCCFYSFCDKCIRDYIITNSMCVCGVADVLADDLIPNKTVRETISSILESTSSTENLRSFVQGQDMGSARDVHHKIPSHALSSGSKGEAQPLSKEYSSDTKEVVDASEAKVLAHSLEKKGTRNADPSETIADSESSKAISAEKVPIPEEVQEKLPAGEQGKKKIKKKRLRGNAADMQWRAYQDFGAENFFGMPLGPSVFDSFQTGRMPLRIDDYMLPFTGAMPYMSFIPGPFDVPFGGSLPQYPFAAQGYMMPDVPRGDHSELHEGSMGMNQRPPIMNKEEFEAKKADLRRRRETEKLDEREHCRDQGRDVGSSGNVPPTESKPRLMMSRAAALNRSEGKQEKDRRTPTMPDHKSAHHSQPRLRSRERTAAAFTADRSDRHDQTDTPAPTREHDSPRPPRSEKRRASHNVYSTHTLARVDWNQKGSMFSCISFPGPGECGSKKRKTEESVGEWRDSRYDDESSKKCHFKRRKSSQHKVTKEDWRVFAAARPRPRAPYC